MAKVTLAAARVNKKLTQAKLAEKLGVSRQSVFDWENGKREMRPVYLHAFCAVVGMSEDDILLPENITLSNKEKS